MRNISLAGNRSGPCPFCGAMGIVPDGVFDVSEQGWRLVESLAGSKPALLRAAGIIQEELATGEPDATRVGRRIIEEVPEASPLLDLLRDPATSNLIAVLALIVALIESIR